MKKAEFEIHVDDVTDLRVPAATVPARRPFNDQARWQHTPGRLFPSLQSPIGDVGPAYGRSGLFPKDRKSARTVLSASMGAVGSVVSQIAQIKGARAVGIAGGPDKCRYVTEKLGFDGCIDHRAPDFAAQDF